MHKIILLSHKSKFNIEQRRISVASLLAQSMNEIEIAEILNVHQSTVSRDVTALKNMSRKFVYNLAKSDLAYCYKSCLDGVEEEKKQAWELFRHESLIPKDRLLALKIIKECNESRFALLKDGPSLMNIQMLEERINSIESARQVSQ
jgi:hypothetical protein